jgi:hypothetical protein
MNASSLVCLGRIGLTKVNTNMPGCSLDTMLLYLRGRRMQFDAAPRAGIGAEISYVGITLKDF